MRRNSLRRSSVNRTSLARRQPSLQEEVLYEHEEDHYVPTPTPVANDGDNISFNNGESNVDNTSTHANKENDSRQQSRRPTRQPEPEVVQEQQPPQRQSVQPTPPSSVQAQPDYVARQLAIQSNRTRQPTAASVTVQPSPQENNSMTYSAVETAETASPPRRPYISIPPTPVQSAPAQSRAATRASAAPAAPVAPVAPVAPAASAVAAPSPVARQPSAHSSSSVVLPAVTAPPNKVPRTSGAEQWKNSAISTNRRAGSSNVPPPTVLTSNNSNKESAAPKMLPAKANKMYQSPIVGGHTVPSIMRSVDKFRY